MIFYDILYFSYIVLLTSSLFYNLLVIFIIYLNIKKLNKLV